MFEAASVTPFIKKAGLDEDSPANFRPISNLNNISKLIERLFLSRLQHQILGSPHFDHLQSAYRPHHSTETALLLSLSNVYQAADNSQHSLLVSLDLSAAFDTIDQSFYSPGSTRVSAFPAMLSPGSHPTY
jgi:Reverse transcriptase (RNA-dependent DNA polymerase)